MRKVSLFIISFFFLIGMVFAESGSFKKEWETEKINMYNEGDTLKYYLENSITTLGDGYVNSVVNLDLSDSYLRSNTPKGDLAGIMFNEINNLSFGIFSGDRYTDEYLIPGWVFNNTFTNLNYYDNSGKVVNTKKLNDTIVLDLINDGEYIYSLEYCESDETYRIASAGPSYINLASLTINKYDKNLNQVASISLDDFISDYVSDIFEGESNNFIKGKVMEIEAVIAEGSIFAKFAGIHPMEFKDNKISVLAFANINKDLTSVNMGIDYFNEYLSIGEMIYEEEATEEDLEDALNDLLDKYESDNPRLVGFLKYFALYYSDILSVREHEMDTDYYIETSFPLGYDYGSKYNVASGSSIVMSYIDDYDGSIGKVLNSKDFGHLVKTHTDFGQSFFGITARLVVLDHDNNVILTKEDKDYVAFYNVQAIGDYITCLGLKLVDVPSSYFSILDAFSINDTYHMNSDLLVFDKDGNLVQKLVNGKLNFYYEMDDKQILLSGLEILNVFTETNEMHSILPGVIGNSNTTIYRFAYTAKAIQNDGGNIVIPEAVVPGDLVEVAVLPKKGYTFDYLLITYNDGRTEKVKSNSFVMPNEDITVEAIYKVGNPNTGDFMIIGTILVLIVSCILLVYKSRRKKLYW